MCSFGGGGGGGGGGGSRHGVGKLPNLLIVVDQRTTGSLYSENPIIAISIHTFRVTTIYSLVHCRRRLYTLHAKSDSHKHKTRLWEVALQEVYWASGAQEN